jgi:hypothetical protein
MGPGVGFFLILIIPKRTFGEATNLCRVSTEKSYRRIKK